MPKKQKEQKYEMSLKESAVWTLQAIRLLHRLAPGEMELAFADDISGIIFNYVNIFLMARLIDELATEMRPERLILFAALIIAGTVVRQILHYTFFHIKQYKGIFRGEKKQYMLSRKLASLDYVDAERQDIRDRFFKIKQDEDWADKGINSAYSIAENLICVVTDIISCIALTVSFLFAKVPEGTLGAWFLNSPLFILTVAAAAVLIAKLLTLCFTAAERLQLKTNDASAQMNRMERHTRDIQKDESRALDMRIYSQKEQLIAMRREAIDYGYGAMSKKLSKGRYGILKLLQFALAYSTDWLMYLAVGLKALAGAFSIGSVTQYVYALTVLSDNLSKVPLTLNEMRLNAPYIKKVFDFMELPNNMYQGSLTTEKRSDRQYDIEFRDVGFKYPAAETWALRHVNIKFRVGTRLAVVGENGSGKTTFIKLLCRLYDPQEGQILLNGIDIKKYNPRDYMGVLSVVFQDYFLLSQPLGENVGCSKDYDRKKAEKCLTEAGFGERLESLPEGLDTYINKEFEPKGVQFSGGELQKIAIARALYKNAPFIILDEPTAALDPIAEAEIYKQFDDITGDRTAIYISHRLSSCRFCDEIAVFDGGRIVERGTHDSLINAQGRYRELWEAQAGYYQKES